MLRILFGLLLTIIPLTTITAGHDKKPKWVDNTSSLDNKRINTSYNFKVALSRGKSPNEAENGRIKALAGKIANTDTYKIDESLESENVQGKVAKSSVTYREKITNQQVTKKFYYTQVDEYWDFVDGECFLYTLYAVCDNGQEPIFDQFSSTTSYGATPAFMSIIPGVGQMYKGSTVKGICMLAGVAACGLGALFCENQRSDYKNKMKEQPQFAPSYNNKAKNYETARNICLGATAAVWIYNIIDAAVAKGDRKIVISPSRSNYWSIIPVATPTSAGVSIAYNF